MLKVLLVIYVIGGNQQLAYNQQFQFQEFQTVAQCEAAVKVMKDLTKNWYTGEDKNNTVPALYSTKCWEVPGYTSVEDLPDTDPTTLVKPPIKLEERLNRRWNDL